MEGQPSQIGSYRVDRELGRGGMGVVFLGHDTRLERPVAIKALPPEFALDPERLARFEREAKVLASLNHPNVAGIYGIEEVEGTKYLILEFVEGETLADRLAAGPLSLEDALDVFRQIALGMEAAHEAGVVHRDLKPGNVKITSEGHVKVLDFGLAKPAGADPPSGSDLTQSPTLTYGATKDGLVLGTAGYMSPEQARGRRVDRRTDIWAMGCILYEMLTGNQAFQGETISDTLAAVLRGEPHWDALPPRTPPALRRLLTRCLEKDARKRMRDAADVMLELDEALHDTGKGVQGQGEQGTRSWSTSGLVLGGAAVAILSLSLGLGLSRFVGRGSEDGLASRSVTMASLEVPGNLRFLAGRLSPDGRTLAGIASEKAPEEGGGTSAPKPTRRIYVRRLDRYDFSPVRGSEGALRVLFSSDSRWLAFVAPVSPDSAKMRLMKVPVDGSAPPVAVADWQDGWNDVGWLSGGDFLVCKPPGTSFLRIPSSGSSPPQELKVAEAISGTVYYETPRDLPVPGVVLLSRVYYGPRGFAVDTVLLALATGKVRTILEDAGYPTYASSGHLLFTRGDTLLAAPFDLSRLEVTGGAVAVTDGLRTTNSWGPAPFDLSSDGTLVFIPGGRAGSQRRLVIGGPGEAVTPWSSDLRAFNGQVAASKDGRRLAAGITRVEGLDEILVSDPGGRTLRAAVSLPDADVDYPVWSPDGRRLAFFRASRCDKDGLYWQAADGADTPHPLVTGNTSKVLNEPCAWTPDGKAVVFMQTLVGEGRARLMRVEVPGTGGAPQAASVFMEFGRYCQLGTFSPDGRFFAFTSDASGQNQVYVCPYGPGGRPGPPVPVSDGLAMNALWAPDGKSLAFVREGGRLFSAALPDQAGIAPSRPVPIWDARAAGLINGAEGLDRLPDGRFIMVQKGQGEEDVTSLRVVLNAGQMLAARIPHAGP